MRIRHRRAQMTDPWHDHEHGILGAAGTGWRPDIMTMAGTVMMRQAIIAVCWNFVAITRGMDSQLDAEHAPTRCFGGMRHASEAGQYQHQAGQQREELSHHLPPITPPPRCN